LSQDEDYNDDVDERIDPTKKETMINKKTFETRHNNLNEIYVCPKPTQPIKFYTCPDEAISFRKEYNKHYSSFTPENHQVSTGTAMFPKIPETYKKEDLETKE
jgi:hypothetical protein